MTPLDEFLATQTLFDGRYWRGRMPATQQRQLFGQYLGRGRLWIDTRERTIEHSVRVCFGTDTHVTATITY